MPLSLCIKWLCRTALTIISCYKQLYTLVKAWVIHRLITLWCLLFITRVSLIFFIFLCISPMLRQYSIAFLTWNDQLPLVWPKCPFQTNLHQTKNVLLVLCGAMEVLHRMIWNFWYELLWAFFNLCMLCELDLYYVRILYIIYVLYVGI